MIADVTVQLADGGTRTTPAAPYCAEECDTSKDCPAGMACSWHPVDPKGLCFKDR